MQFDVVINGGGPVGMGLAIELAQRGLSVGVVERNATVPQVPKGQNLTQRTGEHFAAWGVAEAMRTAHPLPEGAGIGGMTSYGTLLSDMNYDWLNRGQVRAFYAGQNARLPQYATERVLRDRVAELDKIRVWYGWEGRALTQDESGVTLDIAERDGPGRETLHAGYLVGCDGARSFVRGAAGIPEDRSDHDRLMALLVFRSTELHQLLERYPGKAFYCVLHPDFDGYWQFFGRVDHGSSWFFHAPVDPGIDRDSHDFGAMLTRAVGRPFAFDLDYVGFWDLRIAVARTYREGRVFIAGDAAHSHPPYGGYGINTGFEDARNLGWKLAAMAQGWGGAALLDSYSAERQPVFVSTARDFIETFIEKDRAFLRSHSPDDPGFAELWAKRNEGDPGATRFAPNYAGSPIVGGEGTPSAVADHRMQARPGHHLAPQPLADGRAVYDALGPGYTLLTTDQSQGFRDAAQRLGVPLDVLPLSDEASAAYEATSILVRPDHFVAWAGQGGDADAILRRACGRG